MKNVPKAFDDEFKTPEEGCDLLVSLLADFDEAERKAIKKAYDYAFEAHKDQTRLSGEPYIMHPLAVAVIIARLLLSLLTVSPKSRMCPQKPRKQVTTPYGLTRPG